MFRHVVMMRWSPEATAEQRQAAADAVRRLPGLIPEIRSYAVGSDAGVNDGNHDFVVVGDFDDVAGYLVYRDHPDHTAAIREYIAPILAERAAIQYEIAP